MMSNPLIVPDDEYNRVLVSRVHPPDWRNPEPAPRYNLVVIGAGTAGLVTAAGAAGLGAKVALVEKHLFGGDCLNVGCVPSKTLIRSARSAADVRDSARFGVNVPAQPTVDFPAVMQRLRKLRAGISRNDSVERFASLGVDVFLGEARFSGPDTVTVDGSKLRFKRAVITTGARPAEPDLPGLAVAGYLTNESVFSLTQLPPRLAVIGGGPIGCELAQAFQRLGSKVVLFHRHANLLEREDTDAAEVVRRSLTRDGVRLRLEATLDRVERRGDEKKIFYHGPEGEALIIVDEILAGAGRVPNVQGLNLEVVGVEYDSRHGVKVNDRLQTTNPRIFAAGDICLAARFTHSADFSARIVIQNALFFGRKKLSALNIPRVTYTDPEVAHTGLSEAEAKARGIGIRRFERRFEDVDRAICEGEEDGFVRILIREDCDQIVGATIVARHAGEMISEISVAMAGGVGVGKLASVMHPYPTQAEAIRQCGDAFNRTRLTPTVKKLFHRWLEWTR